MLTTNKNASTSTVRLAGSTGAKPIRILQVFLHFGDRPSHGGAKRSCTRKCWLKSVALENVAEFMEKVKRKEANLWALVTVFAKNLTHAPK